MVSVQSLRHRLVSLLDTYKQLEFQSQLKTDELAKCKLERLKNESQMSELYNAITAKERQLEEIEEKIRENEAKTLELEKSTAECQKTSEQLTEKLQTRDDVIEELQSKTEDARARTAAAAQTYSVTIDRLRETQTASERLEKREEGLRRIFLELEEDIALLTGKISRMDASIAQANNRQVALEKCVSDLSERLDSANARTHEAETVAEELSLELAFLEEEANDWKQKGLQLQQQLDMMRTTMQTV